MNDRKEVRLLAKVGLLSTNPPDLLSKYDTGYHPANISKPRKNNLHKKVRQSGKDRTNISMKSNTQIPATMTAAVLTGHGGFDKLEIRHDWPVPTPQQDEVLIRVAACGMNNTDINTRTGWYDDSVDSGTTEGGASGFDTVEDSSIGG